MKLINLAALVSILSFSAAFADNTAKPIAVAKKPTPEPTSTLAPVSSEPESTTAIFGDWSLHCTHVQASGKNIRLCEVLQSIELQGESRPVAQIAFGRVNPEGPLKLTALLPPNVTFPSNVKFSIDDKDTLVAELAWRRCLPGGCFADVDTQDEQIAHWRGQADKGRLIFRDGSGREVVLPFSFRGMSQALNALNRS